MLCGRQELATQYPSTSGSNIVGDILYNLAVSEEEGHSRQHILAFAAKRYGLDGFSMVMLFRHIHFAVGDVFVFGDQLEGELDRTRCQVADSCTGNL
jgi:hypothetical protein